MSRGYRDPKQLEAANPEISAWVSANAGSGKTHVLVNRIARLLLAGAEPASILCLTYTNAAAAEMASRIYARLGGWTGLDDERLREQLAAIGLEDASAKELSRARKLFALALDTPGGFKIQTIHGFCEHILQLFPIEAGMAPGFRILDDKLKKQLLKQAQEEVLTEAATDLASPLAQALSVVTRFMPAENLEDILQQYLRGAPELGAPDNALDAALVTQELRHFFNIGDGLTLQELRYAIVDIDERTFRHVVQLLLDCPPADSGGASQNNELGGRLKEIVDTGDAAERLRIIRSKFLLTGDKLRANKVSKSCPEQAMVTQFIQDQMARLVPLMTAHDALLRTLATAAIVTAAQDVLRRFKTAKREIAAYDFDDLITVTRDLLNDKAASAWVLYKLDKAIEHVLVDEAQDTSPAQWQIMGALTEEFFAGESSDKAKARTLFVVGDQKQSIFSFQGADVRIFESSRRTFQTRAKAVLQSMPDVPLTTSFRTTPAVLKIVDEVFGSGRPARVNLGIPGTEGLIHVGVRKEGPGLFELWPLTLAPEKAAHDLWALPQGVREIASPQRLLARKIAATVKGWIGQRWAIGEKPVVSPDDILILFRKRSALFDMLIAELRAADVPVAGTDRLDPGENLAVLDMLALMRAVTLPADDYALACVLKSPLVSQPLTEETLLALAHDRGNATLWQRLEESNAASARQCIAELATYRTLAGSSRPYEFISTVLLERRPAIAARLGREAEDALAAFADAALAYEETHGASLAGFAEWFRAEELEIKRDMEAGSGEVRLMTVHGSKGLEARIVILPDTVNTRNNNKSQLIYVGEDGKLPLWRMSGLMPSDAIKTELDARKALEHSEYTRLLYVAMTRARDALFVCGAADKDEADPSSWYTMTEAALQAFGEMEMVQTLDGGTGLRYGKADLWHPGDKGHVPEAEKIALPAFLSEKVPPPVPVVRGVTPTLLANPELTVHAPERARMGRVVHRILQTLPEVPEEQRLAYAERVLRRNGLSEAVASRLLSIVTNPENAAVFAPGSEAEVAIGTRLPDGTPLTGAIDRLAIGAEEILIVDYKSDAVPSPLKAQNPHVRQLASYCFTLQKIYPGKKVRAAILWTGLARLEWVEAAEIHEALAQITGPTKLPEA